MLTLKLWSDSVLSLRMFTLVSSRRSRALGLAGSLVLGLYIHLPTH